MQLRVKRVDPRAQLPARAHPGDAGLDLFSIEEAALAPGARLLVRTGLVVALPPGTEGQVRPRSGLALRHGITVLNAPGTIDEGYRGELMVLLVNHGSAAVTLPAGSKIAQLVIQPVTAAEPVEVAELPDSERGGKGFGSSGE